MRRSSFKYFALKPALAAVFLLLLSCLPVKAQYNENIIKAAYIERIMRFVEWPVKDSLRSLNTYIIGVYDENDFYNTLKEVFKDKPIKEHQVKIIPMKSPEQINTCNLCYISGRAISIISKFVDAANSSGILLMSASTDFCKAGVHINFYIEDEKLKFEINEKSMNSAGFKVSYLLMQNSRIVQ
jgi:hypothetical protein